MSQLNSVISMICVFLHLGSAAATVRRSGCDEDVRESQDQCEPSHLPHQ